MLGSQEKSDKLRNPAHVPKASKDVPYWDSWKSPLVRQSTARSSAMNAGLKQKTKKEE